MLYKLMTCDRYRQFNEMKFDILSQLDFSLSCANLILSENIQQQLVQNPKLLMFIFSSDLKPTCYDIYCWNKSANRFTLQKVNSKLISLIQIKYKLTIIREFEVKKVFCIEKILSLKWKE